MPNNSALVHAPPCGSLYVISKYGEHSIHNTLQSRCNPTILGKQVTAHNPISYFPHNPMCYTLRQLIDCIQTIYPLYNNLSMATTGTLQMLPTAHTYIDLNIITFILIVKFFLYYLIIF